jgi:hypothetical protein
MLKIVSVHINVILRRVYGTIVSVQEARRNTCSECVSVALVILNAKRMGRTILSLVPCLAVSHFCKLSGIRNDFRGKKGKLNMELFLLFVRRLSETFIIPRKI